MGVPARPIARTTHPATGPRAVEPRSLAALAFTAAAFTAVLFLLVIELVAGFAISPLRAALGVSVLPLAALAAAAIPGRPTRGRSAARCCSPAARRALAFLPAPTIAWTIVPQILAGAGMGLALPALSAPSATCTEAARTLVARHAGIVLVLAILAPVATAQLTDATDDGDPQGRVLVLDAQIDPLKKLELAPALLDDVDTAEPRATPRADAVEARRADFADNAAVYDRLGQRLDDVVVAAIQDAFRIAYLIAAALALLAARRCSLTAWRRPAICAGRGARRRLRGGLRRRGGRAGAAGRHARRPCKPRDVPGTGGIAGAIQERRSSSSTRRRAGSASRARSWRWRIFDAGRARDVPGRARGRPAQRDRRCCHCSAAASVSRQTPSAID